MATNKDIVRAIEEAWDRNDTAALDGHFSPDFDNAHSGAPGLPVGLAGAKMAHGAAMVSFPDRRVEIVDLIAEGDRVFVRTRITGTNTGGAFTRRTAKGPSSTPRPRAASSAPMPASPAWNSRFANRGSSPTTPVPRPEPSFDRRKTET